jgi:hypothetical protein
MSKSKLVEHLIEDFEFQGHEYDVSVEIVLSLDSMELSEILEIQDLDTDTTLDETDLPDEFISAIKKAISELEPTDLDVDLDEEED